MERRALGRNDRHATPHVVATEVADGDTGSIDDQASGATLSTPAPALGDAIGFVAEDRIDGSIACLEFRKVDRCAVLNAGRSGVMVPA
jgi:hypothetical protein